MLLKSFRAGGIRESLKFWEENVCDPSILSLVKGLTISLSSKALGGSIKREKVFSEDENLVIKREITTQLSQNVIERVFTKEPDEYISNIFVVPKRDGGDRVILNLKRLNEYVLNSHFKMNSLNTAIDLMRKDCYMASVDFKSAYYSVSVRKFCRKLLRFRFDGIKYQYTCLPMGLATGPRDFTKIVKILFKILRDMGHLNTFYLDDSFLVGNTYESCAKNVIDTVNLTRKAGFTVNPEKSVFTPTKQLKFLGVILDSNNMTVSLSEDKIISIKNKILGVIKSPTVSLQYLAELVGKMVSVFCAVTYSKLYYRQLEIEKTKALRANGFDFSKSISLSPVAREDLNWWLKNLGSESVKIESKIADHCIQTDASSFGYGGVYGDRKISGLWSPSEITLHINVKELMAIQYSLELLFSSSKNCCIKVLTDNKTALTYINNMGGKMQGCHNVAKRIWKWAIQRNIWLMSAFIPGKDNVSADRLSRVLNENTEWSLSKEAFSMLYARFPEISIDLFASHLNNKLDNYCSWFSDPKSSFCDAFSISWTSFCGYAFPPFSMIGRVLRKVELEKCELIIVVPEWRTQYWFSKLMNMSVSELIFLPRKATTVTNPLNHRASRITSRFLACKISGSPKTVETFQTV